MLRNPYQASATSIVLWSVFILNIAVLLAALLVHLNWLFFWPFVLSFSVLVVVKSQKERFLKAFFVRKRAYRRKRQISKAKETRAKMTADF